MMKKIFLLVTFFVLGKMWSYAQYPITQNIGSDSTIVVSKGALQSRLINVTYPDTATANLQRIRQYPGAQIATTSGGINLWVRNTTATAWLPINTGSGNNIYTIDGTLTGNRTLTGNNYSLTFTGLSQFLLTVGNQTFTVRSDSASLTRKLSYASNRGSTFTLYSLVDKNYVDSAIASSPAGTVTQINTNNNTGITGGPITSTGTLAIDTLLISTRAWRQKGVDSLQANINLKLNIVDTTGMLANYVNSVGYGLGKTSQTVYVDSASLSNYYLRRKDSLTATNPLGYVTQKILADTAAAIRSSDLGGTVTSVATNNGTGITGGTITTSGTLAIDTTIISTRAWRQKGVDSLQANINLKLNISDTASMLNPYLRKVDTASLSNRINQKLNISDTASMLSPYLRSNTAAATYVPQTRTLTINGTTQDLSANRTYNVGTVTSVGLTMPAAFNVANSPVTGSGTLAVTGAGLASQYIRGDGTLANFPGGGGGGGASVSYYLNGSVNQGTFGGNTYYQMNKTPILGAGTNFTTNTNGYIAQFITNAGDPALLNIPAGNWNFELFFSASSGGGTPSYYVELYKYDGTTFTLIASGSSNPDVIVNSAVDAYFSALPVPQTTLTLTDRLAVRIYVTHAGRTITLHTEDNNLCQVVTTFTTGITAINSLTAQVQYLTTGTSGTDFNISSLTDTHTFNLPVASGTNTGKLSNTDWTTFNNKVGGSLVNGYITKATGTNTIDTSQLFQSNGLIGIGTTSPTQKLQVSGNAYVNGQLFAGDTALSVYQVEGILNTPYVLGRKAVNNTLSTEARPTGVMGHVVGRGSIANRLQAANFYTTTDSASTANSTGSLRSVNAWTAHNGSGSLATAWGSYNIVQNKTTGTITNAYGSVSGVENRGATSTINKLHGTTTEIWNNYGGTIDTAFGQVISIYNNNAASNIGAVYGLSIGKGLITPTGGTHYWRNSGTIGTSYGLYLDSSIDVGTTKYALFSNSNSNSYFRAKLGIGTTSPDSAFQVATGAYFQRGIRASGLPQAAGTKALRIDASGTISYADTLIDAGGTVTSVATNNGTGITGGTITTSGTLAIDTLLISTRAWRQKGVDSVAALANTKVSGSLISGYIPKATGTLTVDTSQIYQNNGNIGIGTISPASGFKVDMTGSLRVGNGSSYNNITINGNSGAGSYLRFQKNGTNKGDIGPYSAVLGGTPPYSGSNDDLTYSSVGGHFFNTNAGIKMYLNNAGNLGLSTSPDSMLTVLEGAYFQRGVRMSGLPSAPGTRALRINANGTLSVADTLVDAGGTVTSVATNNGTGITGGTITTTGTLAIDTLRISTRAWRQKGIDSVQANLTAGLATKLNISDTASMLSPYLRSNVAAATYVPQTRTITINGTSQDLSANRTYNVGTVTSVATNTGTGITGGTITSSGTIAADTLLLSTRAWRQKGIDSVAALINSNVSGTTNYVAKFTGTNTIGNSQLFDNGTNVGIGTTSPAYKLQAVVDNSYSTLVIAATSLNGVVTGGLTFGGIYNSDNLNFYSGGSFTTKMVLNNSGNLGLGVTPSAWNTSFYNAIEGGDSNSQGAIAFNLNGTSNGVDLWANGFFDGTNSVYKYNGTAGLYQVAGNVHRWYNAPSGTAGNAISFTQAMTLDASGNLLLGMTTAPSDGALAIKRTGSPAAAIKFHNASTGDTGSDGLYLGYGGSDGTIAYLYQRENDAMVFGTNNTERMRITSGGNLLIGTTTDGGYKLDVSGIGRFTSYVSFNDKGYIRGGTNTLDLQGGTTGTYIYNSSYNTVRMAILDGGNVGIGTTSPSNKLDVIGRIISSASGNQALLGASDIQSGGATVYLNSAFAGAGTPTVQVETNHPLLFATNNTERMRLDASGNLLVGGTSALANGKLQVTGSIGLSGNTQIRQATNGDGNTLQVFATQFVAGNLNSYSYGYSGGGLMASVSAGDGVLLLDAGRTTSTEGRVKIANTTLGNVSFSVEKNGVTTLFASTLGNVGIGTTSPSRTFQVNGYISAFDGTTNTEIVSSGGVGYFGTSTNHPLAFQANNTERMRIATTGAIRFNAYGSGSFTGTRAYDLSVDASGNIIEVPIGAGTITGSGTTNYIPKFTSSSAIGNSVLYESGGTIGINATSFISGSVLDVRGGTIVSTNSDLDRITINPASRSTSPAFGMANGSMAIYTVGAGVATPFGIGTFGGAPLIFGTTNTERMRLDASGNLGLGTSSPNVAGVDVGLTINGGSNSILEVNYGGTRGGFLFANSSNVVLSSVQNLPLLFNTANIERMRLDASGNLGVGTTIPQAPLDVLGRFTVRQNDGAADVRISGVGNRDAFLYFYEGSTQRGYVASVAGSNNLLFGTGTTERMRLDASGNLGLGVTPSAWGSGYRVIEGAYGGNFGFDLNIPISRTVSNGINNGTNWVYKINAPATLYDVDGWNGQFRWYTAPSGTAGSAISFTQAMTLDASGSLLLGNTNSGNNILRIQQKTSGNTYGIRLDNADNTAGVNMYMGSGGSGVFGIARTAADNFVINASGNVGIGTTSPSTALNIQSTVNANIGNLSITSTNNDASGLSFVVRSSPSDPTNSRSWMIHSNYSAAGTLEFLSSTTATGNPTTPRFTITKDGNVGIGTTSPATTLDVNGSFRSTGLLISNDRLYLNGNRPISDWISSSLTAGYSSTNGYGWVNSQDNLVLGTNGTERMRITSGGNVGIGTSSPQAFSGITGLSINGNTGALFLMNNGTHVFSLYNDNSNTLLASVSNTGLVLGTNNTERMRITNGGELLINTTTDRGAYILQAQGSATIFNTAGNNAYLEMAGNGNTSGGSSVLYGQDGASGGYFWNRADAPLYFATNATERMRITAAGNVGIGTTSPGYKLSINGSAGIEASEEYFYFLSNYSVGLNARAKIRAVGAGGGSGYGGDFRVSTRATNNVWNEDAFIVNYAGNVGIGTTADLARTTILSDANAQTIGLIGRSGDNISTIRWWNNAGNTTYTAIESNANYTNYNTVTNGYAAFFTNNTERMRITSGGNVLVGGTYSTSAKLQIISATSAPAAAPLLALGQSTGGSDKQLIIWNDLTNNYFAFNGVTQNVGWNQNIVFQPNGGNVGIGTTSPGDKLTVNGGIAILAGNSIYFNNPVNTANSSILSPGGGSMSLRSYGVEMIGLSENANILFSTGGTERMRVTSAGLVGINTSSPATTLDVRGNAQVKPSTGTDAIWNRASNDSGEFYLGIDNSAGSGFTGTAYARFLYATNFYPMTFHTNNSERMRITSGGNVGIGTTTPDMLLSVRGTDNTAVSSSTFWNFSFEGAELSNLSNTVNTVTGLVLTGGSNRTSISAVANILESTSLGALAFFTGGSGVANTIPERMRITSGGDLLIATTTDAGAYPLQVNGSVYATAYYESSDLRLKNVLSERQGSDGINTITFKWKDGRDSLTHIGYAAQQVEKVLPDAVKTNTDGYKTINYDEVQSLKIANLEQEIAELKKIIKQLIDKK